jgi:uncharacterized repeat protein (TIGR01451 family)
VVTVRSAGQSSTCVVTVPQSGATPTPSAGPTGPVAIIKQARNTTTIQTAFRESVSASDGQRLLFLVRLTDREGDGAGPMLLTDTLPPGMSYVPGSTTIDGDSAADGIVSGGLSVPALAADQEHEVLWSAIADRVGTLTVGAHTAQPQATVQISDEDGASFTRSDAVTVTVYGTGVSPAGPGGIAGGAGTAEVGAQGAVMLALTLAVVGSLLYAAYTRSPGFRRRELEEVSRDQGPMDFRA